MEKFKSCGPIDEIIIRASSGVCVPTRNLPRPYFGFGAPLEGVHYATVQFSDPAGARRAVTMNGRMFLGKPIVVRPPSHCQKRAWHRYLVLGVVHRPRHARNHGYTEETHSTKAAGSGWRVSQ